MRINATAERATNNRLLISRAVRVAFWTVWAGIAVARSSHAVADPDSAPPSPARTHPFLKIGVGYADLLGISDLSGRTMQIGIAQVLSRSLVLIEETSAILGGVADRDSDRRFEYLDLSIGLLWTPFTPRPQPERSWLPFRFGDSSALYLKPMIGVAFRTVADPDPSQAPTSSRGPVGTMTVGYVPLQGWDYDFGIEVRGKAALMEGALRYHLDYLVVVSLRH